MSMRNILPLTLLCSCCLAANALAGESATKAPQPQKQQAKKASTPATDRSGKTRKGKASYYSHKLAGKKMADGTPMNPDANIAASKTLPLGTKAKVTNLENGKSAHVEIRDRGPYVDGRIVDVSPKVARQLDMDEQGVAPVEVKPTELPPKQE